MEISKRDLYEIPDEWLTDIAQCCDPDGDYDRDGYSAVAIIWESIDSPDIREMVEQHLSTINSITDGVSHVE